MQVPDFIGVKLSQEIQVVGIKQEMFAWQVQHYLESENNQL